MKAFEEAKVGDRVYCLLNGWGTITKWITGWESPLFQVNFDNNGQACYTLEGKIDLAKAETPTLYWSKPEIVVPPKPKRKVQKTLQVWVNHYGDDCLLPDVSHYEDTARQKAEKVKSSTYQTVLGTLTYEIEEE